MKSSGLCHNTRVTFSVPQEAAEHLRCLAKVNVKLLKELGILGVQINDDLKPNFVGNSNHCELESFLAGNCGKTAVHEGRLFSSTFLSSQRPKHPAGNCRMVPYAVRPSMFTHGGYNQAKPSNRAPVPTAQQECQAGVTIPRQQFACPSANEFVFHNRQHQNNLWCSTNSPIYGQSPPYVPTVFPGTGQMFAGCQYTSSATGLHPKGVVSYMTMAESSSVNPTILNDFENSLLNNTFQTDIDFCSSAAVSEPPPTKRRRRRRKKSAFDDIQDAEHEISAVCKAQVVKPYSDSLSNSLLMSSSIGIGCPENVITTGQMNDSWCHPVVGTVSNDFANTKVKRRRKKSTLDKSNINSEPLKSTQQCRAFETMGRIPFNFPSITAISCVVSDENLTNLANSLYSAPDVSRSTSGHFSLDTTLYDISVSDMSVATTTADVKPLRTNAAITSMDGGSLQSVTSSRSVFLPESLNLCQHHFSSTCLSTSSRCKGAIGLVGAVAGDTRNKQTNATKVDRRILLETLQLSKDSECQNELALKSKETSTLFDCQDLTTAGDSLDSVREKFLEVVRVNSLKDVGRNSSEDVRENSLSLVEDIRENFSEDIREMREDVRNNSSQNISELITIAPDGETYFVKNQIASEIDLKSDCGHVKSDEKTHAKKDCSIKEDPTTDSASHEFIQINADRALNDVRQNIFLSEIDLPKLDSKMTVSTLQAVKDCSSLMFYVENRDLGNGVEHKDEYICSEEKMRSRMEYVEDAFLDQSFRLVCEADDSKMAIDFQMPSKNEKDLSCKQNTIENSSDEVVVRVQCLNGSLDGNSTEFYNNLDAYSFLNEDKVFLKRENADFTSMENSDENVKFNKEHFGLDLHSTTFNQNHRQAAVLQPQDFRQLNALVVCEFKNMLRSSSVRKMLLADRWKESSEDGDGIPREDATLRKKVSQVNKKQTEKSRKRMNGGLLKQNIDIRGYVIGENAEQLSSPPTKKQNVFQPAARVSSMNR